MPTLGVRHLAGGWFHPTHIHTILDGWLGIPKNKAMKLITSTFVCLLLIGFAGASYGQIPAELDEAVLAALEKYDSYYLKFVDSFIRYN